MVATPNDWNADNPTVPQRVYMVSLRRPDSPSFFNAAQAGMTELNICTTMEAEMYGITPRANKEKRLSAPPENMLNMSIRPPLLDTRRAIASGFTPGTGMNEPKRKTTSAPTTNSKRCLSSVSLPSDAIPLDFGAATVTRCSRQPLRSQRERRP